MNHIKILLDLTDVCGNIKTISGGTIVNSGYVTSGNVIDLGSTKDFNLQLGRIINGTLNTTYGTNRLNYNSDVVVVVLRLLYTGTNTTINNVAARIGWYEL